MKKIEKRIFVTQPALPSLQEVTGALEEIWTSRILTNNGPFHQRLEAALADYLGVKYVSLFTNGTLALFTALQALRISGEVITTPYSFVATTNALCWNNIKPVFVDIDPIYCNLDPEKIEAAITSKTRAILPVHVYGNPCNVHQIHEIAQRNGLKVIYDACHTFDVQIDGRSVLNFGDLSVMSFHATKVFNTFEGGAIVCHDKKMKTRIDNLKNFGFTSETTVAAPGINAKMNEVQAAVGLLQLNHIGEYIQKRKYITALYRELLSSVPGLTLLNDMPGVQHCYSYLPVFIEQSQYGMSRDQLYEKLKTYNIYGRRYFFPLISQFPSYSKLASAKKGNLAVAEKKTNEVICLPIYPDLDEMTVRAICEIICKV